MPSDGSRSSPPDRARCATGRRRGVVVGEVGGQFAVGVYLGKKIRGLLLGVTPGSRTGLVW